MARDSLKQQGLTTWAPSKQKYRNITCLERPKFDTLRNDIKLLAQEPDLKHRLMIKVMLRHLFVQFGTLKMSECVCTCRKGCPIAQKCAPRMWELGAGILLSGTRLPTD